MHIRNSLFSANAAIPHELRSHRSPAPPIGGAVAPSRVDVLARWSEQATAWLLQHFATLPEQSIGARATRREMDALLHEPAPEEGRDFASALAEFHAKVAPHALRPNHPRFLAFIPGAPNYVSVLGELLCAGTNFFEAVWFEAAGPTEVELVVLDWFRTWLGMPTGTRGLLTSGGSEANLTRSLSLGNDWTSPTETVRYSTSASYGTCRWIARHARAFGRSKSVRHGRCELPNATGRLADCVRRDARGQCPGRAANAGATNTGTVDLLKR